MLSAQVFESGYHEPGDVIFEDPLARFDVPLPDLNDRFKIQLQDSKGFIWLIHNRTLYKYDGYELKNFQEVPIGPDDLSGWSIATIAEDEFGFIWMGCHGKQGLFRYDPRKETFQHYPRETDPQDIDGSEIWCIHPDRRGKVWFSTREYETGSGLYCYDYEGDSFREFRHDPEDPHSLPCDNLGTVFCDVDHNIWIGTREWCQDRGRLYYYDTQKGNFTEFRLEVPGEDPLPIYTHYLRNDNSGNLYFCIQRPNFPPYPEYPFLVKVSDRISREDIGPGDSIGLFRNYEMFPNVGNCLKFVFGDDGALWLNAQEDGIIRFDTSTHRSESYKNFETIPGTYYFFGEVLCDVSGAIWDSYTHGLKTYFPTKRKFKSFNPEFFQSLGFDDVNIHAVYEAEDGKIWAGINGSLVLIDPETGEMNRYNPPPVNLWVSNRLQCIQKGKNGELLIAARNGLYIFNIEHESFEVILYPPAYGNLYDRIESNVMMQAKNGILWIGTSPGCIRVDLSDKSASLFYGYVGSDQFCGGDTHGIFEDRHGYIWFGTIFGLTRYNPEDGSTFKIQHDSHQREGLGAPSISAMYGDQEGNLWIGHRMNGISYLDARYLDCPELHSDSLKFRYISEAEGLPDLHIKAITGDLSGNIWIATDRGLSKYITATGMMSNYYREDGIHVEPFSGSFHVNHTSGNIYIGGGKGMISFHPEHMPLNRAIPPVVITGFRLHNKRVPISDTSLLKQSITYTDRLDLSHRENFLQFEFAALDYTNPEKNQYKYFMEGIDGDTVHAGTNRMAEYRDMRPGKYTFWVSGSNNDGVWNPDGISLAIIIHPPWYHTAAARSGYFLVAILIIIAYVRLRTEKLKKEKLILESKVEERTQQLRRKNEQILEMESLKTRFFTDVSHEIRTPLSLISGPLDSLIDRGDSDPKSVQWLNMIRRNSNRLLQLVNQLLDISRLDSGHMKLVLEESDLVSHLRMLTGEYSSLAESRKVSFLVEVPEGGLTTWYDREKVEKIATNLLSNAFKFTPEMGKVICRIKILDGTGKGFGPWLRFLVADTGPGILPEQQVRIFDRFYRAEGAHDESAGGTGIGLSLTRELIRLMKGDITLKSSKGKGTVFMVTIPLGREHLDEKEYILKEAEKRIKDSALSNSEKIWADDESAGQSLEVLVVEDNEDLRTFIRENLSSEYRILEAEDGIKGLELARENIPDLIISDVMMPGMNGMELCRELKKNQLTSHIPVIMLTAKTTSKDKMEGLELGADDYIFKPFKIDELTVRIRNILEQRERLKKKYSGLIELDWGEMSVTTLEEQFLKKATGIIADHLHDFDFDVTALHERMAMSRNHLYRKMMALTGESPSSLIRIMRLKKSALLIERSGDGITEISMNVGFSNPSYFAQCFREYFGKTPREYRNQFTR